ncbi:MAG: hypothetical protein ACYTGG_10050 [Planctomycetota bacterium]
MAASLAAGCQAPPQPYLATTNLELGPNDELARRVLTPEEQAEAEATLREIAAGESIVDPARPAPGGLRWSDVPAAVADACDVLGLAVYGAVQQDNRFVFEIRTADARPGRLIVTRRRDDSVYEAEATIGRFHDRAGTADRLIAELDKAMRERGRKPKYDDEAADW